LLSLLNKKADGVRLAERNPVTAYALMASLDQEKLGAPEIREQTGHLANLGKQFPDHAETFHLIDRIVAGHSKPTGISTVSRIETVVSGKTHSLLIIHGSDETGRKAFCYLAVEANSLDFLKKEIGNGFINHRKYGTALASGYGYAPSGEIQQNVLARFQRLLSGTCNNGPAG
jgi:hypothetical protein